MRVTPVVAVCASLLLLACEDEARITEKARAAEETAARIEKVRAKVEAEHALMTSPQHAVPELWLRLTAWMKIEGGIVTVVTNDHRRVQAFPATVGWRIVCDDRGIKVVLGPWVDGDRDVVAPVLVTELTTAELAEAECAPLVAGLSRKLAAALRD